MSTGTDTYHHGDLRHALLEGALSIVRERGLAELSLREVAKAAGVSHAAPYHHFADKAALIRALGYSALGRLDERMAAAEAAAPDDPRERLLAVGLAYVLFAVDSPESFAVMTAPEMRGADPHAEAEPHGETWERLERAVAACQADGVLPAGDTTVLAFGMWSLVQGLAELWIASPVSAAPQASGGAAGFADAVLRSMLPAGDRAPQAEDLGRRASGPGETE